ncbi:MAG: RagB/SusD family nutrient uptake outer membrane protein [Paludibacteraceae bacterium]|nr:RagB/SusD family nutrient uptake outer membrane protein [Paludibacteraceae bacterium]
MKTYRKITFVLSTLLLCTLLSGCMDFEPEDKMGDNQVWNSRDNFQLFANQFYGWLRDMQSTDYQCGLSDGVHSDFRSDLICTSTENIYSSGTFTKPATDANYASLYKRIYYTNLLIKNADEFGRSRVGAPLGEAYFFRAYLHFELVQIYGDAILLTEPLDLNSDKLVGPRDSRTVVIDQVLADLDSAAVYLPELPNEDGRLCKDAAYAMSGRVALYEGTWEKFHKDDLWQTGDINSTTNSERVRTLLHKAITSSEKVMSGGHYALFSNATLAETSYRYMFILEDAAQCNPANVNKSANREYIIKRRHRAGDALPLNITHAMTNNIVYYTRKFANMHLCQDGLPIDKSPLFAGYTLPNDEFKNRDNRMLMNMLQHGENYWTNDGKWRTAWTDADLGNSLTNSATGNSGYHNKKWGVERQVDDKYESMDWPVLRYAEVLLNWAEAKYEYDGAINDGDLNRSLNQVRKRSNPKMTLLSNALVAANGLDMREEIRRERTVEFILEGMRLDDLKRWATAKTEMPQDLEGVLYNDWFQANWPGCPYTISPNGCVLLYTGRQWDDKCNLYPLPSDQLQLNPGMEQNPGWN